MRLVRPVFQSAAVVVQAPNAETAVRKALRQSGSLSETDWSASTSNGSAYGVHAEAIVDNQDIYQKADNPHRELREFRDCEGLNAAVRYLLLSVDMQSRTCNIIPQPWFLAINPQAQADLCSAWIQLLSFVIENDGIDEESWQVIDWGVDNNNVIAFPRNNNERVE